MSKYLTFLFISLVCIGSYAQTIRKITINAKTAKIGVTYLGAYNTNCVLSVDNPGGAEKGQSMQLIATLNDSDPNCYKYHNYGSYNIKVYNVNIATSNDIIQVGNTGSGDPIEGVWTLIWDGSPFTCQMLLQSGPAYLNIPNGYTINF